MRSSTQPLSRTRRSRWRARCGESRPAGSEEGCAEKARLCLKADTGPRRAAHPVHASVASTKPYIHADMTLKQQAADRLTPPAVKPGRYQAPDELLAFLADL